MAEVVGSPAPLRIPPPPPESPLESPPPAQKVAGGGGGSDAPQSSQAVARPPSLKNPTTGSAWMWGRTRYRPPARATGGEGGAFLLGLSDTLAPYSCAFLSPRTTYYFIFDLHSDTEDTRPVLVSDRDDRFGHHTTGPGGRRVLTASQRCFAPTESARALFTLKVWAMTKMEGGRGGGGQIYDSLTFRPLC